jgi:6-phospho-3-hexuloisomerase
MRPTDDIFSVADRSLEDIKNLLHQMKGTVRDEFALLLKNSESVFVTGKGRSGFIANCFAMRLMQMGIDVHVPGEATCPRIRESDLLVALSCSGTTVTTVELARIASEVGAKVLAVTGSSSSPLGEIADCNVLIPVTGKEFDGPCSYGVGPFNNTLFEEAALVYLDALVYTMLAEDGISGDLLSVRHANLE